MKLSYILRHKPENFGVVLDDFGWARIDEVLNALNVSKMDLINLVANDTKKRYSFDGLVEWIRANQGHSVKIDLGLSPVVPPEFLFHGTAKRFMSEIKKGGIKKMGRNHVHLSENFETATEVGRRHGRETVISISSGEMYVDGIEFFLSENGVWLTDYVDPKYFF